MTDRELLQQALDTLRHLCLHSRAVQGYDGEKVQSGIDALKSRLAQPEPAECDGGQCGIGGYCEQCPKTQPENEFNPDWDAMSAMVEEQQRMAKRIEDLEAALEKLDRKSFGEVHPRNPNANCKCEHWQSCAECCPTAHAQPERYTTDAMKVRQAVSEAILQQAEQEPTAYLCENAVGHKYFRWKKPSSEYKPIALYTAHASPQRIWQGLTDAEILADDVLRYHFALNGGAGPISKKGMAVIAAVNAKLKEKNRG